MFRKISLIVMVSLFVFGISKFSFAMMCGDHSGSQQLAQAHSEHEHGTTAVVKEAGPLEQAVNIGNKICPVSNEKINEKTKATYEYEGKIYNFCCTACVDEFKKEPQKYIKKVEEELNASKQGNSQQKEQENSTVEGGMPAHESHHH